MITIRKGTLSSSGINGSYYTLPIRKSTFDPPFPIHELSYHIALLFEYAHQHPKEIFEFSHFHQTFISYQWEQLAPLFIDAPSNVHLPSLFREYLLS